MKQNNPLITAIESVVRFPTTEELFCSGMTVRFEDLKKCLGNRLTIPMREACRTYVSNLADNIIKNGPRVPILISKDKNGIYTVQDGVYRIQAIELIRSRNPQAIVSLSAKLNKNIKK